MKEDLPVGGVWLRQWEEDPLGDEAGADRETLVIWTQSLRSKIYVDLRLPVGSPGRSIDAIQQTGIQPRPSALSARGYSQTAAQKIAQNLDIISYMLRQKSFAGVLEYNQGDTTTGVALATDPQLAKLAAADSPTIGLCTCYWRRDIDYQPPSGSLDIGVCVSYPTGTMSTEFGQVTTLLRETGHDGSYAEAWLRSARPEENQYMALELLSEDGESYLRAGYWVRVANRFAYAVGRPNSPEACRTLECGSLRCSSIGSLTGQTLREAMETMTIDPIEMLHMMGSFIGLVGEIDLEQNWTIHHGTHLELVGCQLLAGKANSKSHLCCSWLTSSSNSSDLAPGNEVIQRIKGTKSNVAHQQVRKWKILELEGCDLPIGQA